MNNKKLRLALVGKDVSKSESERIHRFILSKFHAQCGYENISVGMDEFHNFIYRLLGDFDGFNVTIPYKREVMEYLNDFQGDAAVCSAVNTVVNATKTGYNTDGVGFMHMLAWSGVQVKDKTTLVLGAGGAGRSCANALKNAGAQVFLYQRTTDELIENCQRLGVQAAKEEQILQGGFQILVNCTGVGMHDSEGKSPLPSTAFDGAEWAIDLIYVPPTSQFLRQASIKGVQTLNGEGMLFFQAYYADCIYLQRQPNRLEADAFYSEYLSQKGKNQ